MAEQNGLRIGSFAGAAIIIEPSFLLLGAYVLGSAMLSGGGGESILDAVSFLGALTLAVLIHEFGHAGVAAGLKIPSKRIVLAFFGGYVQFAFPPRKRWHEIAVSAAGPLANLLSYALLLWLTPMLAREATPSVDAFSALMFMQTLGQVSLLLGVFNLLPGFPLDGGHILRAALNYFMVRDRAGLVAAIIGLVLALALVAFALWRQMLWTAAIGALLALTAWAEIQRTRRSLGGDHGPPSATMSNA